MTRQPTKQAEAEGPAVPAQGAGQAGVNLLEGTARPLAPPWQAQVAT